MWELIRNDPILKAISIFIIGIFAFAFAFSIMFGAGPSGMEDSMGSSGYTAATGFGQIILLLSKILIIILLIAIIIAAVKFIQKYVIGNEPIKGIDYLKNKPLLSILVGVGGILLLLLAINMILPANNGNEMMNSTSNLSQNSFVIGVAGLLSPILQFVTVVSMIGLITGFVMYFKGRYFSMVKATPLVSKELCATCGIELKTSWKCCPSCGTEKNKNEVVQIIAEDNRNN